jgi:hypothetical protein
MVIRGEGGNGIGLFSEAQPKRESDELVAAALWLGQTVSLSPSPWRNALLKVALETEELVDIHNNSLSSGGYSVYEKRQLQACADGFFALGTKRETIHWVEVSSSSSASDLDSVHQESEYEFTWYEWSVSGSEDSGVLWLRAPDQELVFGLAEGDGVVSVDGTQAIQLDNPGCSLPSDLGGLLYQKPAGSILAQLGIQLTPPDNWLVLARNDGGVLFRSEQEGVMLVTGAVESQQALQERLKTAKDIAGYPAQPLEAPAVDGERTTASFELEGGNAYVFGRTALGKLSLEVTLFTAGKPGKEAAALLDSAKFLAAPWPE